MRFFMILAAILAPLAISARADADTVRVAALKFGTVNWELDAIKRLGLDEDNGFTLEVVPVAGKAAGAIALMGGAADVVVTDWIWASRQSADGRAMTFAPYSNAVGGLMVAGDSPVETLADARGLRIGVAGGPLDKSWLLLRAYAEQAYGFDLAAENQAVFGAPPLLYAKALDGELDAVINFWHYNARLTARGFRMVATVAEAGEALGLGSESPLLGYVMRAEWAAANPELAQGLVAASRAAKAALAEDAPWEDLRGRMRPETEADFVALRDGFRAGVPTGPVDEAAAAAMFALMAEVGGRDLVGSSPTLAEGLFFDTGE